jgi:hypothetical protein
MVTITGSNFTAATSVWFGSVAASTFTVVSDTTIIAYAPPEAAGQVDVRVTAYGGVSTPVPADQFTYTAAPSPTITSISPTSGSTGGGTVVSIFGSNFTGTSAVTFNGTAAGFTVVSDSLIIVTSPPNAAGTVTIQVTTFGGNASTFNYTLAAKPSVTSISSSSGSTAGGTIVVIIGSNFTGATGVAFGSTAATSFTIISDTAILAFAPPQAAGVVDIEVTTYGGTSAASSADQFTYVAPAVPSVTGVSPNSGSTAGGTVVTINGTGLTGATSVSFGGLAATSFTVISDTVIIALAPPQGTGVIDVNVTTVSGTSASAAADHFTYTAAAAPTVTSINPTSGPTTGGTWVTIVGTNFSGAKGVSFGPIAATAFMVYSDTVIVALAPPQGVATVDITVTTYSATSATSAADQFTYYAPSAPDRGGNDLGIDPASPAPVFPEGPVVEEPGYSSVGRAWIRLSSVSSLSASLRGHYLISNITSHEPWPIVGHSSPLSDSITFTHELERTQSQSASAMEDGSLQGQTAFPLHPS